MAEHLIEWDKEGEHLYETGIRRGVLYKKVLKDDSTNNLKAGDYGFGVAWNGLTSVSESPSGAEETALYADDRKYLSLYSAEEFGGTIEAYTYPDEWAECDGSFEPAPGVTVGQQARTGFGLCYRTVLGNDSLGENYGYKLHIIYNAMASPSERSYETINDSPEAITFSWEYKTTPTTIGTIDGTEYKPTALLVIDSTKCDKENLAVLEAALYGTKADGEGGTDTPAKLPTPLQVINCIKNGTLN